MQLVKNIYSLILTITFLSLCGPVQSQNPFVMDSVITHRSAVPQKDVVDLIQQLFSKQDKKPMELNPDLTLHKRLGPFTSMLLYPGFSLATSYQVNFAGDIFFYADTLKNRKISDVFVYSSYTANKQWLEMIKTNIWTKNNQIYLAGDWRYYKFPTYTYGLGEASSIKKSTNIDYSYFRLYEVAMYSVSNDVVLGLGYNLDSYWNISEGHHDSVTGIYGMDRYGFKSKTFSSGITFNALYDHRLNRNNPQKGSYAGIQLRQNLRVLGSDNDWSSLVVDLRHYIPLKNHPHHIIALWSYNWITISGFPPYLDLPGIGWDSNNNTGRGYVQGRYRGTNLVYLETEYRYPITRNGLLGGVVFLNSSVVTGPTTKGFSKINPGTGFGLRIKINKESNTNLAIDYGFGAEGSRGFFFNLNEVF